MIQQLGAEQQAQPQQEEKFTVDTARARNDEAVSKVSGRGLGPRDGRGAQAREGLGQLGQQPQQAPTQLSGYDNQAMQALQQGQVNVATVMGDPQVSDQAKMLVQSQGLA